MKVLSQCLSCGKLEEVPEVIVWVQFLPKHRHVCRRCSQEPSGKLSARVESLRKPGEFVPEPRDS
jgi:hypothetical protein